MVKKFFLPITILVLSTSMASAQAITSAELASVAEAVTGVCRGGTLDGSYESYDISGEGGLKVVAIKGIIEAGLSGKVEFTEGQWEGIKAIVPDNWSQEAHNKCVSQNMPLFINALVATRAKSTSQINSTIMNNTTGSVPLGCGNVTTGGNSSRNVVNC